MQEQRRAGAARLLRPEIKRLGLRQIYDKHLGNPAPKIGSTPPALYLLTVYDLQFTIYDKHLGNTATRIG